MAEKYTIYSLSIYPLSENLFLSISWLPWITLQWRVGVQISLWYPASIPFGDKHPEVGSLDPMLQWGNRESDSESLSHVWLCDPMDSLPGSSVHGIFPGKNTGVGSRCLLQGIFPTQGSNPGLLHCRRILYHLGHQGEVGK